MYAKTPRIIITPVEKPAFIRSYFLREKKLMFFLTLCGLVFDGGLSLVPILQGKLIDTLAFHQELPVVIHWAIVYLLAIGIIQSARYGKRFLVRRFANKSSAAMRLMVYNNIINRSIMELKDESTGELLTRAVGDVDIAVEGMRKCTTEIFDTGVLMVSYLLTMFLQDWKITLLSCIFIPLSMFIAQKLKGIVTNYSRQARQSLACVTGKTYDMATQAVLLRTNSMEDEVLRTYNGELEDLKHKSVKATILETSLEPLYKAVASLGIVFVFYLGGRQVIEGTWTIGSYSAFISIFIALSIKAGKASKLFNSYQKATVSFARVKPYLTEYRSEDRQIHSPLHTPVALQVSNLDFSYPNSEKKIISGASFKGYPGQIIGITGAIASGKSTLGFALEGLYPYQGSIRLGERELSSLTSFEKGVAISYQGHQNELFSQSIYENVTLGQGGDINPVLQDTCFDKDLENMPQGINTLVGSGGVRLSGGQAARICLARALYRHTPLIILDDPFASVDMKTENQIIQNLRGHYHDCLILLISHRLAIFPFTDQVLYMGKNGEIEVGDHDFLLSDNEDYRQMFQLQMESGK